MLDRLAAHLIERGASVEQLIPLLESADFEELGGSGTLFEQFHPADRCYLLVDGVAKQTTAGSAGTGLTHLADVDWQWAALGWSGFLPPQRYGSTVVADGPLTLVSWPHERLAQLFYADPVLAVRFLAHVLGSVGRQLRQLRDRQLASSGAFLKAPEIRPLEQRRPVVGRADSCLRRSAFFAPFDDEVLELLAARAELLSFDPGERIARQDEPTDGLLLLAAGRCDVFFESGEARLLPFRRFRNRNGIVAGIPSGDGSFRAEASVFADSHCWIYRLPTTAFDELNASDPELGRAIQQRLLARLAGLLGALQVEQAGGGGDAELVQVANMISNSQARLPVTSDLYRLPHLLGHPLTVANALAVLDNVAETGRYHERLLAARCRETLLPLAAESAFYRGIMRACEVVIGANESRPADRIRADCDAAVAEAFAFLDCRVEGEEQLPGRRAAVFILNHLACPEYYQLPNGYHFSFDTAFVSQLLFKRYRESAVRVIRESPGAEFGHNLFYRRLGHLTVPTLESDAASLDEEAFAERRRAAGEAFIREGKGLLAAGTQLVICPEGQAQPAELSPARFHTGAFRLALAAGVPVVPIALAGFHRRYKDGPLVALIGEPVDVASRMRQAGHDSVRAFADDLRESFAELVQRANGIAASAPSFSLPDD